MTAPATPPAPSGPLVWERVWIGMGANVGDRLAALQGAIDRLALHGEIRVEAVSSVWETEAHVLPGQAPQPDHLNAAAQLCTRLAPDALFGVLHEAERAAGRDPEAPRWSPRPLDLDVLLWGARGLCTPRLTIPHPRLAERRFVLAPLAEIVPDLVVPGTGQTVAALLAATPDSARVRPAHTSLGLPTRDAAPGDLPASGDLAAP